MNHRDIRLFAHCRACAVQKPANQSMSEWARLDVGMTATGLLVWCKRCRKEVVHFTPDGLREMIADHPQCACCPGGVHVQ